MGVPGADDVMLNYQSTSFHDANYLRQLMGLRCAPEFESWLQNMGLYDVKHRLMLDKKAMLLLDYLQEIES
jgi:ethanolamine ammonia-lyase large subunit